MGLAADYVKLCREVEQLKLELSLAHAENKRLQRSNDRFKERVLYGTGCTCGQAPGNCMCG